MTYKEFNNLSPGDVIRYVGSYAYYDVCLSNAIKTMSDDGKTVTAYHLIVYCNYTKRVHKIRVLLNRWEVVCK